MSNLLTCRKDKGDPVPGLLRRLSVSTQRWISLLLLSLSVTLVALAWVNRPTFCLDSKIVEKIDMVGASGTQSLQACSVSKESRFSEEMKDLKDALETKLRSLERTFDFMGLSFSPVRISIVDSFDPLVRVHPSHLILSRSVLEVEQVLEKAFLLSVLVQKSGVPAQEMTADQVLWAEVFSDLFLYFQNGTLAVQDPILNKQVSWSGKRIEWPFVLKTKAAYCQEAWRSFFHLSDCQEKGVESDQLFVSLRPFFGSAFSHSLDQLPVNEKVSWFRDVWSAWPTLQIQRFFYGSSVGPEEEQQLADATRGVENWMKNIALWSHRSEVWAKVFGSVQRELLKLGFRDKSAPVPVDLLVVGGDQGGEEILKSLREAVLLASQKTVVFVRDNEAQLLPDLKPFPRVWLGNIQAGQAVLIQCSVPSMAKLKSFATQVQKLMLIRSCQSPLTLSWNQIMRGSVNDFIRDNSKVSFIQFHLPSLKSALAKRNLNPIPLLEEGQWSNPFFQEIGWESPQWDQALKAYKSRAAIEAIESFRVEPVEGRSTL